MPPVGTPGPHVCGYTKAPSAPVPAAAQPTGSPFLFPSPPGTQPLVPGAESCTRN